MALINDAAALYKGTTAAVAAYKGDVKVWPKPVANTLSATIAAITVANETSAWFKITTAYGGTTPTSYKFYSSTNGAAYVLRYTGGIGPHNFDTTYSSTFKMRVDSFDAAGNGLQSAYTNTLTSKAKPITYVQRVWSGTPTATASYNGSNQKRTDASGTSNCYYGYFDGTQGNQKSLVIFGIPAEIRNCVSVDKVRIAWYNNHHFKNSGGTVSMVGHHGTTLPATFPGSTGPLLYNGAQVKWSAPKPGWISGVQWIDLTPCNSSGRPYIPEEIRVNGLQGFGLWPAESGTAGYGYGATNPTLEITYTVQV